MTNCSDQNPGDLFIVRGNNYPPIQWQFLVSETPEVLFDLSGSVFHLKLGWPGGTLEKSSDTDAELAVDLPNSILAWTPSLVDTRSFPLGRVADYELERWIAGTQQTMVRASVVVSEGLNVDA